MPTLLDELLLLTKVDLTGLGVGLREAEVQAERTKAKLRETLTVPVGTGGSAAASIKAFNAELRESEAIQARIQRQFSGSALPAATMSIAQHQRALNAEMKESEAIQQRIARQFATTPLPVASSSLAQHRQQLEEAAKASERYAQSWITSGQRLQGLGMSLTMGVTAPLALIGTTAVRAAMGFDQIIAKMTTLAGVSPQMANSWRDTILNMSVATGRKPEDMAEAGFRIASSGLADKSQTPAILETVAKGSAIGMGSVTDLGETVTSAINAYKSFNLDAAQSTGILIKAIQEGKGEAKDFAPIMGNLGIMAEHAGISFAQMAASVAALTKLGAPAAEAGTMVGRLVDEFMAPKPHSVKMFEDLKIPIEKIQAMLRQPQGLLDALELIGSKTGGSARLERELFPRMEGFRASIGLSGPNLAEARRTFGEVATGGPQTVAQEFSFISQQPFFKTEQAGAEFNSSMIRLGHEILPLVSSELKFMAGSLETITKLFTGMPAPLTSVATVLLEVAAAAGPLAFLGGSIEKLYGQIIRFVPWLAALVSGPFGIGAALGVGVGIAADQLIEKAKHNARIAEMESPGERGSSGALMGAFAGLTEPTWNLAKPPPAGTGTGKPPPHIQTAAENAAAERLARERENTEVDADKAEFAFQKKIAGITGDTDLFSKAGRGALDSEEARAVRRAKEDGQSITDIHRRFAQQRIELGLEETNAFLFAEQKKEQAADKSAQFSLRAIQVQEKAETGLLDVQLGSTRRQIQTEEQRGAPLSRILSLYQQEADLIQKKATTEQSAASRSIPILQTELTANRNIIEAMTKRRDALQAENVTGDAALARDAEVYKINEDLTVEESRQLEIKEKINATGLDGLKIDEQRRTELQRLEQERRRINPTFQEAVQDKLGQSQYGANKEYADIAIDGIHSIGHELTAMLAKGKLDWASLGNVAQDVLTRIANKLLDRTIDSWLEQIPGLGKPGAATTTAGTQAPATAAAGGSSGLLSWLFGGGGAAPTATAPQQTAQTTSDADFWNSVGLGDIAGSSPSSTVSLANSFAGGSSFLPTNTGGIFGNLGGPFGGFGGMGGMNPMMLMMLMSSMGGLGSKGKKGGFDPMLLMMLMNNPLLSGGIMNMVGGAGGMGGMFGGLGGLFGGGGSTAGFDANSVNWGLAGASTIPAGTGTGAGVSSGLFGASGAGGMMGGLGGLMSIFSLGNSVSNMSKNGGGNAGDWMSTIMSIASIAMMFLHDGGIVSHHMGLAPDEHYAKLENGEMVLSRNETANLFSGSAARVPGGYRPDSRIFMANVSASRSMSGGAGGGDTHVHHWHFHGVDSEGFKQSQGQIAAKQSRIMGTQHRRYN